MECIGIVIELKTERKEIFMKSKKYLWTLAAVYMAYLTQGIQAIVISQNLDQFVTQWSTDKAGVYGVIAYTGLARFISVWICGELSSKIGRKLMIISGSVLYVGFFIGLLFTTSLAAAGFYAFMAGLAMSFLDSVCYPAVQESLTRASRSELFVVKGLISASGLIYPLLVVFFRASGIWKTGLLIPLMMSIILLVLALIAPYAFDEELKKKRAAKRAAGISKEETKTSTLNENAQRVASRIVKKPAMIISFGCALYGFIAMATMYSAQQFLTRYGLTVIGMSDLKAAALISEYTLGSLVAAILWSVFITKYHWRTLRMLLIVTLGSFISFFLLCAFRVEAVVQITALLIGFFTAGGSLQSGIVLMQEFHPGNKERNLGIYYTFMGLAAYLMPNIQKHFTKGVGEGQALINNMLINLGLAALGAIFMIYLSANYKKWFGVSVFSKRDEGE